MLTTPQIIRTGAKQPASRLFCFPYAGNGASIYRQWANKLPAWVEVCAIQLPGRENRMNTLAHTNIQTAIEEIVANIQPLLDTPFYLFGHSMGSLISFELARFLRRSNLPQPQRLFVSANRAPQIPRHNDEIHTLPNGEFLAGIKKLGGTRDEILQHEELMELLLPMLRADFTLYETYKYTSEPPFSYPINAYCGTQDKEVSSKEMVGWQEQTNSTFKLEMIAGHHFFIHSQQDVLLQYIAQEL